MIDTEGCARWISISYFYFFILPDTFQSTWKFSNNIFLELFIVKIWTFIEKSKYTVSVWFLFTFSVTHMKNAETSFCHTHVLWGIYTSTLTGYLI